MRKGQFEIMGLAIVVVIISMGVFFLLSLSLNGNNSDPAGQFFNEQFAQNTLDVFLKSTHPECPRYEVKDFYQFYILPQSSPNDDCKADTTNTSLAANLTQAIQNYQGVDFRFQVREEVDSTCTTSDCPAVIDVGTCDTQGVGRPGRQTIPKYPYGSGELEFVLWLCQ
jgi:hypothetical protein